MKRISILILSAALSMTATIACGDGGSGIGMYVTAKSGLLIRADANTNASKLGLAPYGSRVEVLEQSEETMTIGGKTGHWTRVNFEGTEGWSFGGYLSATPPEAESTSGGLSEAEARAFLIEPEYGWVKQGEVFYLAFFPDGRLSIQGEDGEATMWEGTWKLNGNKVTIKCADINLNETHEVKKDGYTLILGNDKYDMSS